MPYRMLSSLAIRLNGQIYLFDAGEGTQINWKKVRLGVRGLKLIAVTHLHADHCLGIPGMVMLRAQMEDPAPLTILGPPGTGEFVAQFRRLLEFKVNFTINVIEWSSNSTGVAYRDDQAEILWEPLKHTRFAWDTGSRRRTGLANSIRRGRRPWECRGDRSGESSKKAKA